MTAPTSTSGSGLGPAPPLSLVSSMNARRRWKNRAAMVWLGASLAIAVVPLGLVMFYVAKQGSVLFGWEFLTKEIPVSRRAKGPGMGPAVLGTLMITAVAALMAIPLGILGAVYLNEYGRQRPLARLVRFMSTVMTGVPSIVMGLFVSVVWVSGWPSSEPRFGRSAFAGALALAFLMLPIVIRSTEEMLRLVPDDLRQASYALGNRKWRTILRVVLPSAVGGITSGSMLAVARAAGETAPLLFTIGFTNKFNTSLFGGENTALAPQIFRGAQDPNEGLQQRSWGAALTLILIVFIFTVSARWVASRFSTRSR